MDPLSAIELITKIERDADVNAARIDDILLWPLIRLLLWQRLLAPAIDRSAHPRATPVAHPLLPYSLRRLGARWRRARELRALGKQNPVDALFISRALDHTDEIGGCSYNRYLDPLIEFCRERHRCVKVELIAAGGLANKRRQEPTIFLTPPSRLDNQTTPPAATGINSLTAAARATAGAAWPDEALLSRLARKLWQERAFFRAVLDTVHPRAVFLVCFYDPTTMALIAACRQAGIPTVDLQHGKGGSNHGMFTHWIRMPREGYALLPDYFWTWGAASSRNIAAHRPPGVQRHRPLIGGNRWLAKWREGPPDNLTPEAGHFTAGLRGFEKVILFSLQPIAEPLPAHVLDAMRQSPPGWRWLVRMHPHQTAQRDRLLSQLSAAGCTNCELDLSSQIPLYALLRATHHHVTCWSSVGYEAAAFGVPTSLLHTTGAQVYAEQLDDGWCAPALDAATLLEQIRNGMQVSPGGKREPYIQTDDSLAEAALTEIFSRR